MMEKSNFYDNGEEQFDITERVGTEWFRIMIAFISLFKIITNTVFILLEKL